MTISLFPPSEEILNLSSTNHQKTNMMKEYV